MIPTETHETFSVLVLAFNRQTGLVPLVRGGKGHSERLWRIPGGGSRLLEFPFQTAVREMKEETGLDVAALNSVFTLEKVHGHKQCVFIAEFFSTENILTEGDEGEEVELFHIDEVLEIKDFHRGHREIFYRIIYESMKKLPK